MSFMLGWRDLHPKRTAEAPGRTTYFWWALAGIAFGLTVIAVILLFGPPH